MLRAYVATKTTLSGLRQRVSQEDGMQTIEWLGIGAIVVALVGAVGGAMAGVGDQVAQGVQQLIQQVLAGGGAA